MTSTEVHPSKTLFFGSDSENEEQKGAMQVEVEVSTTEPPINLPDSKKRLFFASSDDEEDVAPLDIDNVLQRRYNQVDEGGLHRSSSPRPRQSSIASTRSSSAPLKKRKVTPPTTNEAPSTTKVSHKPANDTRKSSSQSAAISKASESEPMYIGSLLVPNAWSTCKGRGWVKPGETIEMNRDNSEKLSSKEANSTKPVNATSGGQLKLTSMFKSKTNVQKPIKKGKEDNVIRFTNSRGFEIGRLPQDVASWISRLLDQKIITFKNCTMVDCPENLHTGAEMLIQLRFYMLANAFKPCISTVSEDDRRPMFNEGQESYDEQLLRERKSSLLHLFKVVDLKPHMKNTLVTDSASSAAMLEKMANDHQRPTKGKEAAGQFETEEDDNDVLNDAQLDMIYKKAQKNDQTMPEMEPTNTFTLTLRPYQKQALRWMFALESDNTDARDANSMHPLWEQYLFPYEELSDGIIDITEEQKPFYFNSYSGELSLTFPRAEKKCRGGILADVGMGKTIMISSLLHTSRDPQTVDADVNFPGKRQLRLDVSFRPNVEPHSNVLPPMTLIVAPTSLISQWANELERSSVEGSVNLLVWHGVNRDDLSNFAQDGKVNVVITSYGVLGSEWVRNESESRYGSPLYQIEWFRVVLDEAHNCKSRTSRTAKACHTLKARRRWALTGTPIVNKLEDLYSLLCFPFVRLKEEAALTLLQTGNFWISRPDIYHCLSGRPQLPFLNRDPKAIEIVQVILESVLLRREKNMRDRDGKPIVELPAKEVVIERLEFSPLERKIYDSMYIDAKKNFDRLNQKGLIGKNYTHILAMLMRLRRAVLHPSLVQLTREESAAPEGVDESPITLRSLIDQFIGKNAVHEVTEGPSDNFAQRVLTNLDEMNQQECAVCLDLMEDPVLIPKCLHTCCKSCALAFLQACDEKGEEGHCPICRSGPVRDSQLIEIVKKHDHGDSNTLPTSAVFLRKNDFNYSTKLKALMEDLRRLRDQDPCFRAVVFSQFTSFLDLIEVVLRRDEFSFFRFDGEMSVKNKAAAVEEFTKPSRNGKVFVVSLKAGGVGLNLTVANHVYMMDCWWNSAIEQQAIDRVHRIGQERTVYVKQFIVSNTIEDRILKIQKRKTAIVKGALGGKQGEDVESMQNLKIMFGDI